MSFMSVMSVTKRGNQHFYFFSQRAEMMKLKREAVTVCVTSASDAPVTGGGK